MKRVLLVLIVALVPSVSSSLETLSLEEVLRRVEGGPMAKASDSAAQVAAEGANVAQGAFLPRISIRESYLHTDNPVGAFSSKLEQAEFTAPDFAIPALNHPSGVHHWTTRFEVQQPIFHGLTDLRAYESAKVLRDAERLAHEHRLALLRLEAKKAYFATASLREQAGIISEGIAKLELLESSFEQMNAPTSATTTNYLIAQSVRLQLEAKKTSVLAAQREVKHRLLALMNMVGRDVEFSDTLPEVSRAVDEETASSNGKRADVLVAEKRAQASESARSSVQGEMWPSLDAFAGYNLYTGEFSSFEDSYDVGASLTWTLFHGTRYAHQRRALYESRSLQSAAHAQRAEAEADLRSAVEGYKAATAEFFLIESAARKANEALDLARKRYAQGSLPLFDYSQTIQNWVLARTNLVDARHRVAHASARLAFERGA